MILQPVNWLLVFFLKWTYVTDMGTIQPMGGLEILYDLSEDIDYKYIYHGENHVLTDTIRKYSNQDFIILVSKLFI